MFAGLEEAACLEDAAYSLRVRASRGSWVRSGSLASCYVALGCGLGEVKGLASEPRPCRRANLISSSFFWARYAQKKKKAGSLISSLISLRRFRL